MKIDVNLELQLDAARLSRRLGYIIDQTQIKLDNQVLKDSNFYAPEDEGFLQDSGLLGSEIGSGVLYWDVPYARRQYYEAPNKSKDKNPNAQMRWFEVAKAHN